MEKHAIYLDYNATCPVKPAVITAMTDMLHDVGNASSVHSFGRLARKRVESARAQVAALVGIDPAQVIFNSGATEGNNTVLRHFAGQRILVSAVEHSSILESGVPFETIPVLPSGVVDLEKLNTLITAGPPPALICAMLVNNETGVIQPVAEVAKIAHAAGTRVHCDAVQAIGRIPVDFKTLGVDYMTIAAHKFGGPQGVGALVVTKDAPVPRLIFGGGQERRQRSGTENVTGLTGFGLAAELAIKDMPRYQTLAALRDQVEAALLQSSKVKIWGRIAPRVANTIAFSIDGVSADVALMNFDLEGIALSSGSACSSGTVKPSRVLQAMGATDAEATGALRFSIGWQTTEQDIELFTHAWARIHPKFG